MKERINLPHQAVTVDVVLVMSPIVVVLHQVDALVVAVARILALRLVWKVERINVSVQASVEPRANALLKALVIRKVRRKGFIMKRNNQCSYSRFPCSISHRTTLDLPKGSIAQLGQGAAYDLAITPDDASLVVGSGTGLWWYELSSQSPYALWEMERVSTVSISHDSRWIITGYMDNSIKIWDMHRRVCVPWLLDQDKFSATVRPAFAPDGQKIAVFAKDFDTVYLVDPTTGMQLSSLGNGYPIRFRRGAAVKPVTFSMDSQLVASVSLMDREASSDFVSVWHAETGELIASLTDYPDFVYGISFSPCGHYLAVGGWSGTLRVWNISTGKLEIARTGYGKYRMYPFYLPDGQLIAAALCESYVPEPISVLDVKNNARITELDIHGRVKLARFSESGKHLAVASESGNIKVWKIDEHISTVSDIRRYTGIASSVSFASDGKTLAAGYWYDDVRIWDLVKQHSCYPLEIDAISRLCIVHRSPYEELFSISISENTVKIWELGNSKVPIVEFTTPERIWWRAVTLSPKADLLVSGTKNGPLIVWDVRNRHKQHILTAHTNTIQAVVFSPDGKRLASTSQDGTRIWDIESGEQIGILPESPLFDTDLYKGETIDIQRRLKALSKVDMCLCSRLIQTLSFSPCGTLVAGGMLEELILWDATTYEPRLILLLPKGYQHKSSLVFSPCGRYLAYDLVEEGATKVLIKVWDLVSGKNVVSFCGNFYSCVSLGFSPDSTLLASSGAEGTIILWDMKPYL